MKSKIADALLCLYLYFYFAQICSAFSRRALRAASERLKRVALPGFRSGRVDPFSVVEQVSGRAERCWRLLAPPRGPTK
jgi:hypothetical protein